LLNRRTFPDFAGCHNIHDLHSDQIATAQLAFDGQIEERQIAMIFGQFQPDSDRPDMFWF